jgi:glycosyltransferase involved in cell wall biosynthesis
MFQYAQCVLKSLEHAQHRLDIEVVLAYGDQRWASLLEGLLLTPVKLRHVRLGGLIARAMMTLFIPSRVARFLSRLFNPLVVELNMLDCDVWIFPAQDELSWQVSAPVITTIHDLMHRYERGFPEAGNWWRYQVREHRFRNLAREAKAVLVDSELGKTHVIESYAVVPDRIHPLPYVAPSYILDGDIRQDFDSVYDLPSKFYFYPAQFWQHKNHWRLILALQQARQVCGDMKLVLAGGLRHEYKQLHRAVKEQGLEDVVRFVGYVPDQDMAGFYKRARALVMPTFFGPTNIPPLEAMAAGCPVLISGSYAMQEQCGDAAQYFNPASVDEMCEQMTRLWTDDALCATMVQRGLARTREWGLAQFEDRFRQILILTLR